MWDSFAGAEIFCWPTAGVCRTDGCARFVVYAGGILGFRLASGAQLMPRTVLAAGQKAGSHHEQSFKCALHARDKGGRQNIQSPRKLPKRRKRRLANAAFYLTHKGSIYIGA